MSAVESEGACRSQTNAVGSGFISCLHVEFSDGFFSID